jgi:hypothetical protein
MRTFEEVLAEALRVTREAQLPPHLESIAFEKAIDAFYGTASIAADIGKGRQSLKVDGATQSNPIDRIASKLDIDLSLVEEVFSFDPETGIQLIVGVGKLEAEKTAATRELATLVAGSRQLGGIEDWTQARTIREVCQHYGRFDSANFAATLTQMDEFFGFKDKGLDRKVKLNKLGCEEFKRLILTLARNSK